MNDEELWIEIHDPEISSTELAAELARRVAQRQAELGEVHPVFPTFGFVSELPQPPSNGRSYNPNLYHHLRMANEMPAVETTPLLAPSPATRIPLLGRLWQLIRGQVHDLVLFYVNRLASHEMKLDNHLISSLNELTRVSQAQQDEIEHLQSELQTLKETQQ
jgi:hypothetical protein